MPKYKTVNLTKEQHEKLEMVLDLLETRKQGPYGGYGGSISKGDAIAYACETILEPLRALVEQETRIKRAVAAAKRGNNNPGIVPGVSRK
jgi:hypothetical protein